MFCQFLPALSKLFALQPEYGDITLLFWPKDKKTLDYSNLNF